MATAVMVYDTLKLAEQLEHEAGFDASRAKSMARILAENTGGNLATREDILLTKGELKTEIQGVRGELQGMRSELRSELQSVKGGLQVEIQSVESDLHAEIRSVKSELKAEIQDVKGHIRVLYWMTGTTLAGVAAILSIIIGIGLHAVHLQ